MASRRIKIDIIVPLFNDLEKIKPFCAELKKCIQVQNREYKFRLIFIDDGSEIKPINLIKNQIEILNDITYIELSRNFGKESALLAGIFESSGDAAIILDVDLQDPIEIIPKLISKWIESESDSVIVRRIYGAKSKFETRKFFSRAYTRIFNNLSDFKLEYDIGETRLLNRNMLQSFQQLGETHRYSRALFNWLGYQTEYIDIVRAVSLEKSRFNTRKLIKLGVDGITSFSVKPLRLLSILGFLGSSITLIMSIILLGLRISSVVQIPGYSSTLLVILGSTSIQLFCMGILGEYIGKILGETKRRPNYLVKKTVHLN